LSDSAFPVLLPGATIGIFGGGQLGRLTAMAARSMGYRILVLDPDPACPARFVVDGCIEAAWNDAREATRLARACDVVTLEIEQISLASLNAAASLVPVRPGEQVLEVIQDRIVQKDWLTRNGFPVGPYRAVRSLDQLRAAVIELGGRCFCKSATGGYDGRGQGKVGFSSNASPAAVEQEIRGAWQALGSGPGVVEQAVDLEREISILVARSPSGQVEVYPAAWNHHEHQILAWSVIPAPLPVSLAAEARQLASSIADRFLLEGILAVELFVTKSGRLLVNELAPRPHNSYHASERACVTSQFEQLVRAVCNLPLGPTAVVQPCAIANLLGDLWLTPPQQAVIPAEGGSAAAQSALTQRNAVIPAEGGSGAAQSAFPQRNAVIPTEDRSAAAQSALTQRNAVIPAEGGSGAAQSAFPQRNAVIPTEARQREVEGPPHLPFSAPAPPDPATFVTTSSTNLAPAPNGERTTANGQPAPTPRTPHFDRALAVPGVRLHLYEKLRPRPGRKMGHLSAVAPTPEAAVALVLRAMSLL
jgi:5-(carboxyamino)imidazole ribonucleotide synthase